MEDPLSPLGELKDDYTSCSSIGINGPAVIIDDHDELHLGAEGRLNYLLVSY